MVHTSALGVTACASCLLTGHHQEFWFGSCVHIFLCSCVSQMCNSIALVGRATMVLPKVPCRASDNLFW